MEFKHALAAGFLALILFALASAANSGGGNSFSINSVELTARAPLEARSGEVIPIHASMRNNNAVDAMGRIELLDADGAVVDYGNVLLKGNSQSTTSFEVNLSKFAASSNKIVFTARLKAGGNAVEKNAAVLISGENILLQVFADGNAPVNGGQQAEGIESIRARVNTLNKTQVRLVVVKGGNAIVFQKNLVEKEYSARIALAGPGEYEVLAGEIIGERIIARKSIKFAALPPQAEEGKQANDWSVVLGLGALVFLVVLFILFKKHVVKKGEGGPSSPVGEFEKQKFVSKRHRELLEKWSREGNDG